MIKKGGDYDLLQEHLNHENLQNCETCQKHSPSTNSVKILDQITISSSNIGQNDVPKRFQVMFETEHPILDVSGDYLLQQRLINRYPYWKHTKHGYVIWYNNVDEHWSIGLTQDIGTSNWIFGGESHPSKWPNEIQSYWRCRIQKRFEETVFINIVGELCFVIH